MVSCRRAVSACYYALFHCLAGECADLLIGATTVARNSDAWQQVYRALDHGHAKGQCNAAIQGRKYPPGSNLSIFASLFVEMQVKRHDADYDPRKRLVKSDVEADIARVEEAIRKFLATPKSDRRAFCAWVILRHRKS